MGSKYFIFIWKYFILLSKYFLTIPSSLHNNQGQAASLSLIILTAISTPALAANGQTLNINGQCQNI